VKTLKISAPFNNGGFIADRYTCKGPNMFPQISVSEIPAEAAYLAIVVDDPDAPGGAFTHFTAWNVAIGQGAKNHVFEEAWGNKGAGGTGSVFGMTDFGKSGWGGPCPPPGKPHRYFFKIYALKDQIEVQSGSKIELETIVERLAIAKGETVGLYKR